MLINFAKGYFGLTDEDIKNNHPILKSIYEMLKEQLPGFWRSRFLDKCTMGGFSTNLICLDMVSADDFKWAILRGMKKISIGYPYDNTVYEDTPIKNDFSLKIDRDIDFANLNSKENKLKLTKFLDNIKEMVDYFERIGWLGKKVVVNEAALLFRGPDS